MWKAFEISKALQKCDTKKNRSLFMKLFPIIFMPDILVGGSPVIQKLQKLPGLVNIEYWIIHLFCNMVWQFPESGILKEWQ